MIDTVKAEVPIWKQEFYSGQVVAAWLDNQTADAKRQLLK